MAKRYRPGDVKWVAYPDGYGRVEIVEKGSRGFVFKNGDKPENPYVVREGEDAYVVGEADIHDTPMQASLASAKMRKEHGLEELLDNPLEDDEEEDELDEDELDEDLDEDEED